MCNSECRAIAILLALGSDIATQGAKILIKHDLHEEAQALLNYYGENLERELGKDYKKAFFKGAADILNFGTILDENGKPICE